MENTTNGEIFIEMSLFVENIVKQLIIKGESSFKYKFLRRLHKVTETRVTTEVYVKINNNLFKFMSTPKKEITDELRLVSIEGPITKLPIFKELVYELIDEHIRFKDNLYSNFFDSLDANDIVKTCVSECRHCGCNNFICSLKKCQACKFNNEDVPNCDNGNANPINNINADEITVNVINADNVDDEETDVIFIKGLAFNPRSFHREVIKDFINIKDYN